MRTGATTVCQLRRFDRIAHAASTSTPCQPKGGDAYRTTRPNERLTDPDAGPANQLPWRHKAVQGRLGAILLRSSHCGKGLSVPPQMDSPVLNLSSRSTRPEEAQPDGSESFA